MLSSRKSNKKSKMRLFSPSSVNGCDPDYYQMKGRIIQQSPYYLHNPETEMITSKKLDKMYIILTSKLMRKMILWQLSVGFRKKRCFLFKTQLDIICFHILICLISMF